MRQQHSESSPICMARAQSLDGTHRWQQALGWAALATPATGMGCPCGPGASRREALGVSQSSAAPAATRMLRREVSGAAKNGMASRATSLPVRRGSQPRTLHKKHRDSTSRRIASYTAAAAQRRYVNNLCCAAPRGLPRALPQARQKLLPERVQGGLHTRRAHDRSRLRPIGER